LRQRHPQSRKSQMQQFGKRYCKYSRKESRRSSYFKCPTSRGRRDRPLYSLRDLLAQAFVSYWKYVRPSRQSAEVVRKFTVACTVFLDKLILFACHSGCRQIVLLGAARDARAFHLALPSNTSLFELDTADMLDSKSQVLKGHPASPVCSRIPIPCDLRSDWSATHCWQQISIETNLLP
jgi:methyltransferase (TIGR00027 family)